MEGDYEILEIERALHNGGYRYIAGVDEAGRGPLAGPVVAAAVILPIECVIHGVTDSKQLTPKQRDRLFDEIQCTSIAVTVSCASNEIIDQVNILQATLLAMQDAVEQLVPPPDYVLVDGIHVPVISSPSRAIPKGDTLSQCIAAASIIAKVTRDRLMVEFDDLYPGYGFRQHKGYGTVQHRQAISRHGPCPIHRRSFKPVSDMC
ncbi:MAG: ribonuclease HII [Candidatus Poribacteria bacterium]|nr:ribonuclease HII [Candidatus Poribacteria bacterium]